MENAVYLTSFSLAAEQVIAGLDRAVSTMKKNECALITVSPEYGFGSTEVQMDLSSIQPSSTILYEVEMLDFVRVIPVALIDIRSFGNLVYVRRDSLFLNSDDI